MTTAEWPTITIALTRTEAFEVLDAIIDRADNINDIIASGNKDDERTLSPALDALEEVAGRLQSIIGSR